MEAILSEEGGLAAVFAASLLAATLIPLSSEAVLFGYLRLHPDHAAAAIALATFGNTAGGMSTYLIGRLLPQRTRERLNPRSLRWMQRYGSAATVLGWLPFVGDGLCLAAGWLRCNALAVLAFMALGRLARYLVIAAL